MSEERSTQKEIRPKKLEERAEKLLRQLRSCLQYSIDYNVVHCSINHDEALPLVIEALKQR